MSDEDVVIREFLNESFENLDQLDKDLIVLEKDPSNTTVLASVFRTIHTVKGTCGFFGYAKLEAVTHAGENLLGLLRDGKLQLTPEIATALLSLVDVLREILGNVETTKSEGTADYSALVETLKRLQKPAAGAAAPAVEPAPPQPVEKTPDPIEAVEAPRAPEAVEAAKAPEARGNAGEGSIRVDVGLLDKLMNLVGELVLARNQVLQYTAAQQDISFQGTSQRLNLITTELQEGVMKTRMQPIGNVWSKFPRVVRDLATACGKQIRIEMEGKDTELDKTIIEAIKDPLTHLVRNSADHGIESPAVRRSNGKPAEGRLLLRAFHEGGQVNIEISDDGAGIDPERIRSKALQKGLITPDHASRMTDREVINLIFMPGFSTAEKVTNVSGRGVGMDVVKTNIEKIGGTVDIHSRPGFGTTLKIKIPLTLAIIPALMVMCGGARYAIPQVSLVELVRLENENGCNGIEMIHGTPVHRLRGNLLPLVYLNRELKCESRRCGEAEDVVNIVVLHADGRQFGLVVDGINDTEEIVVKPLGKQLKGIEVFAGATIMGDGKVALILDVMGIAQRANVVSEARDRALADADARQKQDAGQRQVLLIFRLGNSGRMAIPLSLVARLEEFPKQMVELAAGQEVVQYRGQILPLIRLRKVFGVADSDDSSGPLQVVVYAEEGRSVGLVVDQIDDIIEEAVSVQTRSNTPGILGSAVVQQHVTDLLDIAAIVNNVDFAGSESLARA